ncbi:MAG TPA: carboxypeptidase-like regulatory domain-containing protein, partial [Candidatus Nanoarchaeia archaeon]|nr:carboxypeptidase-like regulatory domain-containing protein [Candidatus Nanoarchaeia archaeon]
MEKRAYPLFALSLFLLVVFSNTAHAQEACCVLQNGCQPVSTASECSAGTFLSVSCTQVDSCDFGCCCASPAADKGAYRNTCSAFFGSASFQNPPPFPQYFSPIFIDTQYTPEMCNTVCGSGLSACPTAQESCAEAVSEACRCGSTNIAQGEFCCAADNGGFTDRSLCQQSIACAPTPTGNQNVRGYVKEGGSDGPAIQGAQVFLGQQRSVTTDAAGAFLFQNVPPGTYLISASKQGFLSSGTVTVQISTVALDNVIVILIRGELDTDGDGVLDSTDYCKYEAAISDASDLDYESRESRCGDFIDNDCDGTTFLSNANAEHTNLADCRDVNCLGSANCPTEPLNECGDGEREGLEQCDVGIACPIGSSCDIGSCVCIPTVCAPGTNQCDPACATNEVCSNCQCVPQESAVCGDQEITGYEECEIGNDGSDRFDDDDELCDGWCGLADTPNACLCLSEQTCGNDRIEGTEQCEQPNDCGDDEICSGCQCIAPCEENPSEPLLTLDMSQPAQIGLTWEIDSACQLQQYQVYRCTGENCCEGSGCAEDEAAFSLFEILATTNEEEYQDEDIHAETVYCYIVRALYQSGSAPASASICTETTQDLCFDNPEEFCRDNAVQQCQNGAPQVIEDCDTLMTQTGTWTCIEDGADADCVYQSNCAECNGVLGLFWPTGKAWWESASVEGGLADCVDITSCYLDSTRSSQDQYYACAGITSCYDYRSE